MIFPFLVCGGVAGLDYYLIGYGDVIWQSDSDIALNFFNLVLADKNGREPFHAAGFQHGHGQNISGRFAGAVENQIAHHAKTDHRQRDYGQQNQQ